jgi:hypothetical protein
MNADAGIETNKEIRMKSIMRIPSPGAQHRSAAGKVRAPRKEAMRIPTSGPISIIEIAFNTFILGSELLL